MARAVWKGLVIYEDLVNWLFDIRLDGSTIGNVLYTDRRSATVFSRMKKKYFFIHNGKEYIQPRYRPNLFWYGHKLGEYVETRVPVVHAVYKQGKHFRPKK